MIQSELISEILELSVEGEKFEDLLFEQINYLTIKEEEHTGVGLFVYFKYEKGIEKYRLNDSQLKELFGECNHQIENFELINSDIGILADTTMHLTDGLIDCVEIWNKLGDYPKEELITYKLKRIE
ncbi:hypothetical protein ABWH96_15980 [Marivirga tractuosa]|uniref:hypothetical protein n=1 Tax=Marivirga tractuosa TaxID=1006 RepID=UPI0035CED0A1